MKGLRRMASEQVSILGQKIECAKFDITQYPLLSDMSALLSQSCATIMSSTCNTPVEVGNVNVVMRAGQNTTLEFPEGTALYAASNHGGVESIYIAIPPELIVSVSECLLGGAFAVSETQATVTKLDLELSQIIVDELVAVLNWHLIECGIDEAPQHLSCTHSTIVTEEVLKEIPSSVLFGISVDLEVGSTSASRAVSIYFPIELVDRFGFLEKVRQHSNDGVEQTQWRSDFQSNIEQCQIELGVELGRHKTSISDLSRLDIGQIIPLDGRTLHSMDVTMKTDAGLVHLGVGQLGKYNKSKAVKLMSDLRPDLRTIG